MAITKLMNIKQGRRGGSKHLNNSIRYIMNPKKTNDGELIGGNSGFTPQEVYQVMMDTKLDWDKLEGRQGYHFVISFQPGEVNEEMAYQVIKEFCEEYLGDDFDYVFSIHNDQKHMHGHIVFNSVNRMSGYKYRYENGDWEKYIQPITNKICEKYGLPPLEFDAETRKGNLMHNGRQTKKVRQPGKKIFVLILIILFLSLAMKKNLFLIWKKSVIRFVREILKSMVRIFHFVQWNKKEVGEVTTLDLGIIMRRSFQEFEEKNLYIKIQGVPRIRFYKMKRINYASGGNTISEKKESGKI